MAAVNLIERRPVDQSSLDQILTVPEPAEEFLMSPLSERAGTSRRSNFSCPKVPMKLLMKGLKWGLAVIFVFALFLVVYAIVDIVIGNGGKRDPSQTLSITPNHEAFNFTNETFHRDETYVDTNSSQTFIIVNVHQCKTENHDDCENDETLVNVSKCRALGIGDNPCVYEHLMKRHGNNSDLKEELIKLFEAINAQPAQLESDIDRPNTLQLVKKIFVEGLRWTAIIAGVAVIIYIMSVIWDLAFGAKRYQPPERGV